MPAKSSTRIMTDQVAHFKKYKREILDPEILSYLVRLGLLQRAITGDRLEIERKPDTVTVSLPDHIPYPSDDVITAIYYHMELILTHDEELTIDEQKELLHNKLANALPALMTIKEKLQI